MAYPLLATKLFIPQKQTGLIPRPRLVRNLNQGLDKHLTLVSAPAGFGKTTIICQCIQECDRQAVWLSLDEEDNDPTRFLHYLIKALQNIDRSIGREIIHTLRSSQLSGIKPCLTVLINDISEMGRPFVIVLDDYHVITEPDIHNLLTFILENPPPSMHLILSSRADPPWPLARWRARGEIAEIRSQDLRFSPEEAGAYLNTLMGLALSGDEINALETRTEGWIAGLQMAALAIQGKDDRTGFIQSFTGSHRFIFDYLIEEVLERLHPGIRDFLLKTSILERMCAPLCDAVTGRMDSQQTLDQLDQMNLFIIPLDDQRAWYRYHHMFADLLRQLIGRDLAGQQVELHHKACQWYQENHLFGEAIHHGLAVDDVEQVADLIEGQVFEAVERRELRKLSRWLENIPTEVINSRPFLKVAYAWILVETFQLELVESHLQEAEETLKEQVSLEDGERRHILSHIAAIRAYKGMVDGNIDQVILLSKEALQTLPKKEKRLRGLISALLGTAFQRRGEFEDAALAFKESIAGSLAASDLNKTIETYGDLTGLFVEQGNLRRAFDICQEALQLIEEGFKQSGRYSPGTAYIHLRLSTILRHWNDLEGSLEHAKICDQINQEWGFEFRLTYINLAFAFQAVGDSAGAMQAIRQAEEITAKASPFWAADVNSVKALLWLEQGNLDAAVGWVQESGLKVDGDIQFRDLRQYLTLAQVLLAQGQRGDWQALNKAMRLISRLRNLIEAPGAAAYVLQILIMQALGHLVKRERKQALSALNQALTLGEPGGYVWVFVRAGEPMQRLLQLALEAGIAPSFCKKLLGAYEKRARETIDVGTAQAQFPDPLTNRELEVLRLLSSKLSIPDIATELVISIGTTRTHIKRIYRKLDAHSRFEAVIKAQENNLI